MAYNGASLEAFATPGQQYGSTFTPLPGKGSKTPYYSTSTGYSDARGYSDLETNGTQLFPGITITDQVWAGKKYFRLNVA